MISSINNDMETKEVKIVVPPGYEVDKENSTFECIKFKKVKETKTWKDLTSVMGYYINTDSQIKPVGEVPADESAYIVFLTKKHAKSALAMAQISQLMPFYGGEITDEEWENTDMVKYILGRYCNETTTCTRAAYGMYSFLAFHTAEQRNEFLKYNERLVKDYFMID